MINRFLLIINMANEAIIIGGEKTSIIKKAIARILYSNNIERSKISEILNLSQPMVSNYCGSTDDISNEILNQAKKISNKIIEGYPITFNTCITFSDKYLNDTYFIAEKNELISDEKSKVIENLNNAFLILKGKGISQIIPKVKINIAMAKEDLEDSNDIAAFLNGLMLVDDKITGHNGIRFGKSKHLSSVLLDLSKKIKASAIMNIAYIKNLEDLDFKISYLSKDFQFDSKDNEVDILLHKGDFGIEPCAYILGEDAVDVSKKLLKIIDGLKDDK